MRIFQPLMTNYNHFNPGSGVDLNTLYDVHSDFTGIYNYCGNESVKTQKFGTEISPDQPPPFNS